MDVHAVSAMSVQTVSTVHVQAAAPGQLTVDQVMTARRTMNLCKCLYHCLTA